MKRILAALAAALLTTSLIGIGAAASAPAPPPKAIGICANTKNGGYTRTLEAANLTKSQFGKCRKGEAKVGLITVDGLPATLVFKRGPSTETCKRTSVGVSATWTFTCTTPSPAPAATPSPTPTP